VNKKEHGEKSEKEEHVEGGIRAQKADEVYGHGREGN
jgi:hypothetical protein